MSKTNKDATAGTVKGKTKSIEQIKNMLKAQGLTGDEFKSEFHRQALAFSKQLIDKLFSGYQMEHFKYTDAVPLMAHIAAIFDYALRGEFYHDFAEHFQIEVFNASNAHTTAFCEWHGKIFDAPEPMSLENLSEK